MSDILDPPTTLLVAGADEELVPAVADELRRGVVESVRTARTSDEVVAELSADDAIGCVLVATTFSDESGPDLCRAIRGLDDEIPVLLSAEREKGDLLRAAVEAGVTDVVPQSASPETLRDRVDEAFETYHQRLATREESDMLTAMLEDLGKSIYVKDTDLRIIHHADVGGGLDSAEARGKTDLELYEGRDFAEKAYEDGMRVIDGEQIIDREERIQDADMWMRTTKVPWRDESGDVRGLIGHTIDITEYKRTERKLEELQHRFTTFTRQLQHDLKTQLQIAFGLLDRIEAGEADQFDRMGQTIDRIAQIVEDYDKLAKRSIRIDDEMTPTNLRETVDSALSTVDTGDAAISVDVDPEIDVNAPDSMVQTVLVHLLRDATDHARAGDEVRVGTTADGFYVADSNGEIPAFKREVVEQDGYTSTQDGRGRELSIVKDQIERHIWTLSLSENDAGGAKITVENCLVDRVSDRSAGTEVELDERAAVGRLRATPAATYDENANRWTVTADGNDVYRQDNDFYFVYATVDGPVAIQGKVHEIEHVHDYSKGGFMVRESLDEDATYAYLGKTPAFGSEVLWRSEFGANGQSQQLNEQATLFDWYRLERSGDEVRMFLSMDGERWQEVDRRTIAGDDPVHVGMVVCSMILGDTCEAVFEDVTVTELPTE